MFSQSDFDMKSVLCLQNSETPSAVSTQLSQSDDSYLPSSSVMEAVPELSNIQEKTVLLNATMEMTLTNPTEIVTVESKAKKPVHSGKPKAKKNKGPVCQSSEAENSQVKNSVSSRLSDVERAATCTLSLEDIRDTGENVFQSPKTHCISVITTHIPKLSKSETDNNQIRTKDTLKSHRQAKSKPESSDLQDLDDYFKDHDLKFSNASESVTLPPEKDGAEEGRSNITCRRSRTKGRSLSSVTRKTTFPLQLQESDSSRSILKEVCNKVEEKCVGTKSAVGSHKSRCRETFVISVTGDSHSSNTASPEVGAMGQDLIPSTVPFNLKAKKQSRVNHVFNREYSETNSSGHSDGRHEETKNSCKRPWLDISSCSHNHEVLPLKHTCTSGAELQKPKKARREESSQSSKGAAMQREEWVDPLNDRKKKVKNCSGNKEFIPEDEGRYLANCIDGLKMTEERLRVESCSDVGEKDGIFEKTLTCNPKHHRNASKRHTPTRPRNPRETFVVHRRRTQGSVSRNHTRTSLVAYAYSHMMDATEETAVDSPGGLLLDEMPPWLARNVSNVDTEVGSVLATPRRGTSGTATLIDGSAAVTTEASLGVVTVIVWFCF